MVSFSYSLGYAVTHVYLAARRIGRIRMNTVWFFR